MATNGCAHRAQIEIPLAQVIDLNDNGQVLGVRNTGGGSELVIWSKAGFLPLLPPAGASGVTGVDLNNNGEAVGCGLYPATDTPTGPGTGPVPTSRHPSFATSATSVCHVVRWNAQGIPTDLGLIDPAAHEAKAYAINDAGVIVGTVVNAAGQRAFVRAADGTVTYIPTPGATSAAVALNEQGEVTGWYTNGTAQYGPWHGFVWSQTGGTLNFSDLPVSNGQSSMLPVSINEAGDVVGMLYTNRPTAPTEPQRTSTFLHTRADGVGVQDLSMSVIGLAAHFINVVSINDQGEILGFADAASGLQPYTWARTRPDLLPVRFEVQSSPGLGTLYAVNNWNEVLDSYTLGDAVHNVVWTWNPERYR